jgi:hypothetical protein
MKCPRCQHENPAGMRFCGQCGAPLASVCPTCGAANPVENRFCGQCAASLTQVASTPKFTSPDAYTPRAGEAQQTRTVSRIAWQGVGSREAGQHLLATLEQGLRG